MAKVFLVSGTSWAGVETDGSDITVECIGGGGGSADGGCAGGGGEYAKKVVAYSSGASVSGIQIGQGGAANNNGTETHWNTNVVIAKPGLKDAGSYTGGLGGTGGTGDVTKAGGNGLGWVSGSGSGSGGGGAGGPNAAGNNGSAAAYGTGGRGGDSNGSQSGHGDGGAGGWGTVPYVPAVAGYTGTEFDASYGSGGGGGGGAYNNSGAHGGLYGGGAGGSWLGPYAHGANGIIVITYTPAPPPVTKLLTLLGVGV